MLTVAYSCWLQIYAVARSCFVDSLDSKDGGSRARRECVLQIAIERAELFPSNNDKPGTAD